MNNNNILKYATSMKSGQTQSSLWDVGCHGWSWELWCYNRCDLCIEGAMLKVTSKRHLGWPVFSIIDNSNDVETFKITYWFSSFFSTGTLFVCGWQFHVPSWAHGSNTMCNEGKNNKHLKANISLWRLLWMEQWQRIFTTYLVIITNVCIYYIYIYTCHDQNNCSSICYQNVPSYVSQRNVYLDIWFWHVW